RPGAGFDGLRFEVFLLDGENRLDTEMQQRMCCVVEQFPGAQIVTLHYQDMNEERLQRLDIPRFNGFPAVATYWEDLLIHRQQGLIDADRYVADIERATSLHVAKG